MERRKRGPLFFVVAVSMGVLTSGSLVGDVGAQERQGREGLGVDVTVRRDSAMTGPEQLEWVEKKTKEVRQAYFRVQNMLDAARKEKDTLKITCLDDKLTQIHVNMKGIEERTESMRLAVNADDQSAANQQFSILEIYVSRIQGLVAEAENCIGDVDIVLGETETLVTIDEDITAEDPTQEDTIEDVGVEPGPLASGYY